MQFGEAGLSRHNDGVVSNITSPPGGVNGCGSPGSGGPGRGFPTTVERYGSPTISAIAGGVSVVYRGTFSGSSWNVGTPSGVFATPGESCWTGGGIGYGPSTPCDHFGVGTSKAPTATTYKWLTQTAPNSPTPNGGYRQPAGAGPDCPDPSARAVAAACRGASPGPAAGSGAVGHSGVGEGVHHPI